jgi:FKBP12-rapamycin complex-associated protein
LHVLAPTIVALFEGVEEPHAVRLQALQTLGQLCRLLNLREYASRIIHPLARLLQQRPADTRRELKEMVPSLPSSFSYLCSLTPLTRIYRR